MNFYVNSQGQIIRIDPEDVFQGSVNVNTINFIGAFPSTCPVTVAFRLPTGVWTTPASMGMHADLTLPGVQQPDGTQFNIWQYTIPGTVTEHYGIVNLQFYVYAQGSDGTGNMIATASSSFEVKKGVPIVLPDPSDDYKTLLTNILSALQQLQEADSEGALAAQESATAAANSASAAEQAKEEVQQLVDEAEDIAETTAQSVVNNLLENGGTFDEDVTFKGDVIVASGNSSTHYEHLGIRIFTNGEEYWIALPIQNATLATNNDLLNYAKLNASNIFNTLQEFIDGGNGAIGIVKNGSAYGVYFHPADDMTGTRDVTFQDKSGVVAVLDDISAALADYVSNANLDIILENYAELDDSGKIPSALLPSYVDDVVEYANLAAFPATGESGKIYVALDTNKTYRWGGTEYVEISESLALGETSSTAYAGNKGKQNADNIAAILDGTQVVPKAKSDAAGRNIQTTYATKNEVGTVQTNLNSAIAEKQDTLIAGTNITIVNNVISATGGGGTDIEWATDTEIEALFVTSFATASWAEIAEISESGNASSIFSVGDEKTIELTTGEQVTLVILGFNHDDLTSGGKAGITIGMKNLLATTYPMNTTATNVGGWGDSGMRTSTMATLLTQLPSDLQSVIKQVYKRATAGNQSEIITTPADKLWLFAEVEIDGTTTAGYADEGEQYEYWKTVKDGTVADDRKKYLSNGSGSAKGWWLRSPSVSSNYIFRCIYSSGSVTGISANNAYGVCFGFCI